MILIRKAIDKLKLFVRKYLLWNIDFRIYSCESPFHAGYLHFNFWIGVWDDWQPMIGWMIHRIRNGVGVEIKKFTLRYGEDKIEHRKDSKHA